MNLPAKAPKPAHLSVTIWGLVSVAVGIALRIAVANGVKLAGAEDEIPALLEGIGVLIAGYGRIRK
jgi:hypothetical protein